MKRNLRNAVLASLGIGALAISAATFASAGIGDEEAIAASFHIDDDELMSSLPPAPVEGVALFTAAEAPAGKACYTRTDVVSVLDTEKARYGGETVMLGDGLEQAFSDAWRYRIKEQPIRVSAVFAHLVTNPAKERIADVIEIDAKGCALSRTILSGDDWDAILKRAAGAAV